MKSIWYKNPAENFGEAISVGNGRIGATVFGGTGHEKIYLNEINTIPGSLSFYLWEPLGIGYKELLDRILTIAVKRQTRMQNVVHSFETNVLSGAVLGRGSKG